MAQATVTFNNAIATIGIRSGASSSFATVRDTGNALNVGDHQDDSEEGISCDYDGANYSIDRFFFHFDTSSIPDGATILSAFLRIVGTSTTNVNTDSDSIQIVASTVTSNDTLATSDWGNLGSTEWGILAFASYNNAGNNDISLNVTGLANISLTGVTKLAIRSKRDTDNSAPTSPGNNETFSGTGLLSVTYEGSASGLYGKIW